MPQYGPRMDSTIAALIAQQGENAARGAAASGAIWGRAVEQLGGIAAGAVQQHQENQILKKRQELVNHALDTWDGNPETLFRALVPTLGPEKAMDITKGAVVVLKPEPLDWKGAALAVRSARRLYEGGGDAAVAKAWPVLGKKLAPLGAEAGVEVPPEYAPGFGENFKIWDDMLNPPKEGALVDTVDAQGRHVKRIPTPEELRTGVPVYDKPTTTSYQAKDALVDGRAAQVAFDPQSGRSFMPGQDGQMVDVTNRVRPIRNGVTVNIPSPTAVAQDNAELIRGIAEYRIQPSATLLRSKEGKAIMEAVAKLNPSYDQTQWRSRNSLRADYTSGKTANNIDSLNTAVDHLNTLKELGTALKNGDVQGVNAVVNNLRTQFGDPRIVEYKTAASAVESEVASLLKKTGATDQEINTWRQNFGPNMSQAQMDGAINTALKIMRGRERALQQRWKTGMNSKEDYPIYGEEQQAILDKLGYGAVPTGTVRTIGRFKVEVEQ